VKLPQLCLSNSVRLALDGKRSNNGGTYAMPLRIEQPKPPTMMSCLNCQLLGRRKLLCSKKDVCKELPIAFRLGPLMLVGRLGTVVAFVFSMG
jgi:hypothetical protein